MAAFGVFLFWVAGEDWYDRLGRPMDEETRTRTIQEYCDYLEEIAPRIDNKRVAIDTTRRLHRMRRTNGDEAGALRALTILEHLTGERAFDIRLRGVANDSWTTGPRSDIIISNESTSPLWRVLRLGYPGSNPQMPITAEVRHGREVTRLVFDRPKFEHVILDFDPGESGTVVVSTDKLFQIEGTSRSVGIQLQIVESIGTATVQSSGVADDGWTLDGEPGVYTVTNTDTEAQARYLELGFFEKNPTMPTNVRVVEVGARSHLTFADRGFETLPITVPGDFEQRIQVSADASFSTPRDRRDLGVHVEVVDAPDGAEVEFENLLHDGWTQGKKPATLILKNGSPEPATIRLKVGYFLAHSAMPVSVEIGEPRYEAEYEFSGAGTERFFFVVEPMQAKVLMVICQKTFTPVDDSRRLGLHTRIVEVQETDPVSLLGVQNDGWTTDAQVGRVTIRNTTRATIRRRLVLKYFLANDQMPITTTVSKVSQQGQERFVFDGPGRREYALVVEPGREHTWKITTDKYFKPQRDSGLLGVNVEILE